MKNLERMDYESVYQVFDTLHFVFGAPNEGEVDDRCQALWVLFLSSVGWTQDEFWAEWDRRHDDVCPDCGEPLHSHDDVIIDKTNQN
jgi:hypothetical protein